MNQNDDNHESLSLPSVNTNTLINTTIEPNEFYSFIFLLPELIVQEVGNLVLYPMIFVLCL